MTTNSNQPPTGGINLTFEQLSKLVKRLLACSSMSDQSARETVIRQMPPQIANSITFAANPTIHVTNIVQTCLRFTNGLQDLVSRVQFFDQGTIALAELEQYLQELKIYPWVLPDTGYISAISRWLHQLDGAVARQDWPGVIGLDNEVFRDILNIANRVAAAYRSEGIKYRKAGKLDDAFRCFDRAVELVPTFAKAYRDRGSVYADWSDYERALRDYDLAIGLDPLLDEAYNNRGWIFRHLGNYSQSLREFDKAIDLEPGLAGYYYNRSLTYKAMNDLANQKRDLEQAARLGYVEAAKALMNL